MSWSRVKTLSRALSEGGFILKQSSLYRLNPTCRLNARHLSRLKKERNKDAAVAPTQDRTSLRDTNSIFFRLARLLPNGFYQTAVIRWLLRARNREEAEGMIGMAGLLVEILTHGWLASSLLPTHIGQWMLWLPFHVPAGPDVLAPLAMAVYLLAFKLIERFLDGLQWSPGQQSEFAPTSLWTQWVALLPYASLAGVTSPVVVMALSAFISFLHLNNDGKRFLPRIQSNPLVGKLQTDPVLGLVTVALLLINSYSDFPFGMGFIIAFVLEMAVLEIGVLHSYPPESELALLAMRQHDSQAQVGRSAFTQAVIRDILLGKKHLPPLGPVLVLNPGYHGFAVRELERAIDETMSRKREWNRYPIPVFGLDRTAFLTQPLPGVIQKALNPHKVVVLSCRTSLPMEKRERFLSHVLQSFADYGVLLILEDSVYRKEKGARNASWRLAGTSTTWIREKAPRRVLHMPDQTKPREEFVVAKPATSRLQEKTLIIKRDAGNGPAAVPKVAPRDRVAAHAFPQPCDQSSTSSSSPKPGSTTKGTKPYPKTYPPQGGNGRNRAEQSGTLESRG